jgi:hypothetical protein
VAHTCANFGWYMLLVELPTYMKSILRFNISQARDLFQNIPNKLSFLIVYILIEQSTFSTEFWIVRHSLLVVVGIQYILEQSIRLGKKQGMDLNNNCT